MNGFFLATIGDAVAGGFGVTAALLLVGGGILLRSQRARLNFALAQSALEKGLPPAAAGGLPAWLVSLRQALLVLAAGVGLAVAGGGLTFWSAHVPMPPTPPPPPAAVEPPPIPGAEPRPPHPPRPSNEQQRWDRAQDALALGLGGLAGGGVLALLGVVRIAFAVVERRYEPAVPPFRPQPEGDPV